MNNINPGTATQSRALVLDSNKNISTINSVKVNNLQLQNTNLEPNNLYDNNITNYTTAEITNNANNFKSICWADSLNLFIAVSNTGTNNRVMTSPNGITWTTRTSASNNNWTSICWSRNLSLLVAISNSGTTDRIMTSSDGITWTTRTSVNDYSWNSICWSDNLNIFVPAAPGGGWDGLGRAIEAASKTAGLTNSIQIKFYKNYTLQYNKLTYECKNSKLHSQFIENINMANQSIANIIDWGIHEIISLTSAIIGVIITFSKKNLIKHLFVFIMIYGIFYHTILKKKQENYSKLQKKNQKKN